MCASLHCVFHILADITHAGTTDAIFLEKPQYYDLIIDLTTSTPVKATRPAMYTPRQQVSPGSRSPSYKLSSVRFTWSDVKLVSVLLWSGVAASLTP